MIIASCTDNMHNLENELWLFVEVADFVGIYELKAAEGFLAFNIGLIILKRDPAGLTFHLPGEWHTLHLPQFEASYPAEVDGSYLTIPLLDKWKPLMTAAM